MVRWPQGRERSNNAFIYKQGMVMVTDDSSGENDIASEIYSAARSERLLTIQDRGIKCHIQRLSQGR